MNDHDLMTHWNVSAMLTDDSGFLIAVEHFHNWTTTQSLLTTATSSETNSTTYQFYRVSLHNLLKAHSHRARLSLSTGVDELGMNAQAL